MKRKAAGQTGTSRCQIHSIKDEHCSCREQAGTRLLHSRVKGQEPDYNRSRAVKPAIYTVRP
jgi:hypothetical protein